MAPITFLYSESGRAQPVHVSRRFKDSTGEVYLEITLPTGAVLMVPATDLSEVMPTSVSLSEFTPIDDATTTSPHKLKLRRPKAKRRRPQHKSKVKSKFNKKRVRRNLKLDESSSESSSDESESDDSESDSSCRKSASDSDVDSEAERRRQEYEEYRPPSVDYAQQFREREMETKRKSMSDHQRQAPQVGYYVN